MYPDPHGAGVEAQLPLPRISGLGAEPDQDRPCMGSEPRRTGGGLGGLSF
jgi:hypothetical protein